MRKFFICVISAVLACASAVAGDSSTVFKIGKPDASAGEFKFFRNLDDIFINGGLPARTFRDVDGAQAYFKNPPVFEVGKSRDCDWSFVHPIYDCRWSGIKGAAVFSIVFDAPKTNEKKLYLKLGFADSAPNKTLGVEVLLNGKKVADEYVSFPNAPAGTFIWAKGAKGTPSRPVVVEIPAGSLKPGKNTISLKGLPDKKGNRRFASWLVYDFIELSEDPSYPKIPNAADKIIDEAVAAAGSEWVVFCISGSSRGGHWYENIGTLCRDNSQVPVFKERQGQECFSRMGGKLVLFNVKTREYKLLLDDPDGGVRDATVSYDGKKILFSYRKGTSDNYNLYEIDADGKNLERLPINTNSNDIEPCYLPNGDIMYSSDRMHRTVQCWLSPVTNLHRYYRREGTVRLMSGNPDVDNTPSVLQDGRVLYMRWDYNHRNQVMFHHLWTINPDGSNSAIFYGNTFPQGVFLSAKQVPESQDIVMTISPGHGISNHMGYVGILRPPFDPSSPYALRFISAYGTGPFYDVWPVKGGYVFTSDDKNIYIFAPSGLFVKIPLPATLFNTKHQAQMYSIDYNEKKRRLPSCRMILRSVVPVAKRAPEMQALETANYRTNKARVFLQDIYIGRNMMNVKRGSIDKLMITRVQPTPVNYHGGYAPTGFSGTFAIEEIVGVVPVYEDGSAFFEVPAGIGVSLTAIDKQGNCVKRMMSSTNFAPGTQTSCVGCHENRTEAPDRKMKLPIAYKKGVSKIQPIEGLKNTIDFWRDVQPLLDKYCVKCHSPENPNGSGVILSRGLGINTISARLALQCAGLISSDNNGIGSAAPYSFGSGNSKIARFAEGKHNNSKFEPRDLEVLRRWLDIGSPHISTYAAKGVGVPYVNRFRHRVSSVGPVPSMPRRCFECHSRGVAKHFVFDHCQMLAVKKNGKKVSLNFPMDNLSNYIDPENSPILKVPLAKSAGGSAGGKGAHPVIFKDKNDPDYKRLLAQISEGAKKIDKESPPIMSKNFRPSYGYVFQMQRCGILPKNWNPMTPVDPYEIDFKYFRWIEKNVSVNAADNTPVWRR